ncbi:MAG: hypothetical protein ACLP3K_17015, partial [Candidatus Acidiferrales bacterium]
TFSIGGVLLPPGSHRGSRCLRARVRRLFHAVIDPQLSVIARTIIEIILRSVGFTASTKERTLACPRHLHKMREDRPARVCGELLILLENQQFATHRSEISHDSVVASDVT